MSSYACNNSILVIIVTIVHVKATAATRHQEIPPCGPLEINAQNLWADALAPRLNLLLPWYHERIRIIMNSTTTVATSILMGIQLAQDEIHDLCQVGTIGSSTNIHQRRLDSPIVHNVALHQIGYRRRRARARARHIIFRGRCRCCCWTLSEHNDTRLRQSVLVASSLRYCQPKRLLHRTSRIYF